MYFRQLKYTRSVNLSDYSVPFESVEEGKKITVSLTFIISVIYYINFVPVVHFHGSNFVRRKAGNFLYSNFHLKYEESINDKI